MAGAGSGACGDYGVALGRSRRIKTNAQYDKNNKTTGRVLRHGSSVLGSQKKSEINLKASYRGFVHGSGMGIWPGRVSWQISTIICTYFTAAPIPPHHLLHKWRIRTLSVPIFAQHFLRMRKFKCELFSVLFVVVALPNWLCVPRPLLHLPPPIATKPGTGPNFDKNRRQSAFIFCLFCMRLICVRFMKRIPALSPLSNSRSSCRVPVPVPVL